MTDKNTEELAWTNGHVATFCPDGDNYVVMFNQDMLPLLREKGELRAYIRPVAPAGSYLEEAVQHFEKAACQQTYKMRDGVAAVLNYANESYVDPLSEEGQRQLYERSPVETPEGSVGVAEEIVKSWLRGAQPEKAEYLKMLELASYVHNRAIFQMARAAKLAKPDQSTEYRVGWFTSSSNPRKQVRCLFEGEAAIAEAEKHHSFVCWCDTSNAPYDTTVLESIDLKAEAGLCQFTHGGTRAFLKDIREIVKEALVPREDETSITHYIGGRMVRHVQVPPGMSISFETEEPGVTRVIVSK